MLDQLIHILHKCILIVVASTLVKYYMMQDLCRGFKVILAQPEPIVTHPELPTLLEP